VTFPCLFRRGATVPVPLPRLFFLAISLYPFRFSTSVSALSFFRYSSSLSA
jgi:hypothetical protein